ncbi:hypothetical protein MMC26_001252 [Xylographa opegraphella]|nr:hypothetical protein [Xylographa opegraphella]
MPAPTPSDPTFRSYSPPSATAYLRARGTYSTPLYSEILAHHLPRPTIPDPSPNPDLHTLLDLGCGPGNSTRDLALYFQRAVGADPSEAMIAAARAAGGRTGGGEAIRWVVGEAEGMEGVLERSGVEGGVDMITAGMAAHWFDMRAFWAQAARVLNPGGTVALWTVASLYCREWGPLHHFVHFSGAAPVLVACGALPLRRADAFVLRIDPAHPSAPLIQSHLFDLELSVLAPYSLPPLELSRNYYDALPLPWSSSPPEDSFPASLFVRKTWDRDGVLSNGEDFFGGSEEISTEDLERQLGTASMVTRWRAAHPELGGTARDCVKECVGRIKDVVGEERFRVGGGTALLLFRKRA